MTQNHRRKTAMFRGLAGIVVFLSSCCVLALDPSKPVEQYVRTSWSISENLPSPWVSAILQTKDGFLWLGTQEGLVRFDGARFSTFDKYNTPGIKHNNIRLLLEDSRDNTLWVGTYGGGLTHYSGGSFHSYTVQDGLPGNFILGLAQDQQGALWVGTDKGLAQFRDGHFQLVKESTEEVTAVKLGPGNSIWAATATGIFRVIGDTLKLQFALPNAQEFYFDHQGVAWIGTPTDGLYTMSEGKIRKEDRFPQLRNATIGAVYQDREQSLWLGTTTGLVCRLRASKLDCLPRMNNDVIRSIQEDREGNLWIGTETSGITRVKEAKFTSYGSHTGLDNENVIALYQDKATKNIWIGGVSGLTIMDENGHFHPYQLGASERDNGVDSIAQDIDGTAWLGTDVGLKLFRNGKIVKTYSARDGLARDPVHALLRTHDGTWWIGNRDGGLTRFQDGKFTVFTEKDGLASRRVIVAMEDHAGSLWFGTEEGLTRLKDGVFKNFHMQKQPGSGTGGAVCMYEDAAHTIWIGTYGAGLVRLKDDKFTTFGVKDGLLDETVWSILEDDKGNLWMSSNRGLFRIAKGALDDFADGKVKSIQVTSYGLTDGLPTTDFNGGAQASGVKTANGRLLFGSSKGVVEINPDKLMTNRLPPPVVVETVMVNKVPMAPAGGEHKAPVGIGEVEFHFAALSFVAPEKVEFKYMLEGFDDGWIGPGAKREVRYTNLAPGRYRFRVIAANNDGVWNQAGATYEVYLEPSFYQTRWFYALCALTVLLLGVGLYRLRLRNIRKREEELVLQVGERTKELKEEIVEHQKTEKALQLAKEAAEAATRSKSEFLANMSHEVRTPLNGVMGVLELLRQSPSASEREELLGMAQESADTLLVVINDILDFSKIEAGKLEFENTAFDLAETVAEAARTMALRAHQKKLELTYHISSPLAHLLMGDALRLKQVLVNLIGNAIKFTSEGHVSLNVETVWRDERKIELKFAISDTGIGIPEEKKRMIFEAFEQADASVTRRFGGTGLGLAICSRIVHFMDGRIWVESEPGKGSTFSFTAKFNVGAPLALAQQEDLRGRRVLIVDDNDMNRQILHRMVEQWGMQAVSAESGEAGLTALLHPGANAPRFNLILTDHLMPGMTGLEFIRHVRTHPEFGGIAVMMLTSDNYQNGPEHSSAIGLEERLMKPVKPSDLLAAIRRALALPKHLAVPGAPQPRIEKNGLMGRLKILLAEDNAVNQRLAVRLLRKMGHDVLLAQTGKEAVEHVRTQPVDLILMDVQMPEMDGFAATIAIREWERSRGTHVPIIAMTAHAMKGDEEMCLGAGMNAYITKPVSSKVLEETIHQVFQVFDKDRVRAI